MAPGRPVRVPSSEDSRAPGAEPGRPEDDAVRLSPAYLASLQKRRQSPQSTDLRRPGRSDHFPLRQPTTRAEVDGGDVPERAVAVVDARSDGPARHLRYGIVDGCPCSFPLVLVHRRLGLGLTTRGAGAATSERSGDMQGACGNYEFPARPA